MFDNYLILACVSEYNYYGKKIVYDNLLEVMSEEGYLGVLPNSYCGLDLNKYKIKLTEKENSSEISLLTTELQISLTNKFRQYFPSWDGFDFYPKESDVIFDCGACIGDISAILASMIGENGRVYMFDPIPLHIQYCKEQMKMNESIAGRLIPVCSAVGENTVVSNSKVYSDNFKIEPGGLSIENCDFVRLDDYFYNNNIDRINYIKMDIEGHELSALKGASELLRSHKPKLAICGYHKPSDLWDLPNYIKSINPEYQIYFAHHGPKRFECVFYAF
jgi:FkbM family methyltransferase